MFRRENVLILAADRCASAQLSPYCFLSGLLFHKQDNYLARTTHCLAMIAGVDFMLRVYVHTLATRWTALALLMGNGIG